MPLIELKEIMKFLITSTITEPSFTGNAELKCNVKVEHDALETKLVKHLIDNFSHETSYRLNKLFELKQKNDPKKAKVSLMEINMKTMEKMLEIITTEEMEKIPELLATFDADSATFKVNTDTAHDSVYVAGRYLKYSRSLPQTPWIMNGKVCNFFI